MIDIRKRIIRHQEASRDDEAGRGDNFTRDNVLSPLSVLKGVLDDVSREA